jgi:hypothetical protein
VRQEMHTDNDYLEDLEGDQMITLRLILGRQIVRMGGEWG